MNMRCLSKLTRLVVLCLLASLGAIIFTSSTAFAQGGPERKVLFISGWALWPPNLNETVDPRPGWEDIKSFLMTNPVARRLDLGDEDFLYFSYSGEYERKADGSKDHTRPTYQRKHTSLNLFADYDGRAAIITEILNAYPDATFDIIGHSLGGVVGTYWAATQFLSPIPGGNPLLERVHSVITIDSPLQGKAGLCRERIDIPFSTEIPSEVVSLLPEARARVQLFTIRNTEDKVVPPEGATLQGVWRDLVGNFGGTQVNPCGSEAHGSVLHNQIVMTHIASAMAAGMIWAPTSDNPRVAGSHTNPQPILVALAYPEDIDAQITFPEDQALPPQVRRTLELTKADFKVTVGGLAAEVLDLEDVPLIATYRLQVKPPIQYAPGLYDLTVAWGRPPDTVIQAVRYTGPSGATETATMLVMDVSGSMGDSWRGGVKIESAKAAATQIINLIQRESEIGGVAHQVGLAVFSTDAALNLPLTTDYDGARSAVAAMAAQDWTNIGAGLSVANEELANATPGAERIVILLSDGQTNRGLSRDEILSGPVQDAVNAGTCIYTVGFGDPGDLDEDLLRRIAQATGCGQYYYAPDAFQLENVYVRLRHESTGTVVHQFSGQVTQGETTLPEQVPVPSGQGELHATLHWPGSQLDLILIDPQGRQVDPNYPGATITTFANLVYALIKDPLEGIWQASVFGRDVPEGIIDFNAIFSVREAPQPPPEPPKPLTSDRSGVLMLVVLAGALGAGLWVVAASGRSPAVGVRVVEGPMTGAFAPLRRGALTIGRDPRCEMALQDPKISRAHAQIRQEPGGFFLYDLDSINGTFVNGKAVDRTLLWPGDRIQVGRTTLMFEVYGRAK